MPIITSASLARGGLGKSRPACDRCGKPSPGTLMGILNQHMVCEPCFDIEEKQALARDRAAAKAKAEQDRLREQERLSVVDVALAEPGPDEMSRLLGS